MEVQHLAGLLADGPWPVTTRVVADERALDAVVTSVTHDSRRVRPGSLFCCVRGGVADGHSFASAAVGAGAVAVLVDHPMDLPAGVAQLVVDDTRAAMARVAAAFHGFPGDGMELIGITGTNGKTTTAHLLQAVLARTGRVVEVIGTLTQKRTTPEATDLQERLAELRDRGTTTVVMEVTSHALELHRVDALRFRVGVFTNLSQDHLDFHGTMEDYFQAKARLFAPERVVAAVVNADDPYGARLLADAKVSCTPYRAVDAEALVLAAEGSEFRWGGTTVHLPMGGMFNVMNALAAATTARMIGVADAVVAEGLGAVTVPGRYEPVRAGQPFAVVVDFAHTPDGLERVLQAARSSAGPSGRVLCTFGAGGDRDRTKRPLMGAVAARLADLVLITSDNPRSEDPLAVIGEVLAGAHDSPRAQVRSEPDRRAAIRGVLSEARPGDVVVIAGKGHESGQEIAGVVHPFDDRVVAREELDALGRGRSVGGGD